MRFFERPACGGWCGRPTATPWKSLSLHFFFFFSQSVSAAKNLRQGFCQEGHSGRTQTRPCFPPRGIIGPDICTAGRHSSVSCAAALDSLRLRSSKAAIRPKKFALNEMRQIKSMWSGVFIYLWNICVSSVCVFSLAIKMFVWLGNIWFLYLLDSRVTKMPL